MTDELKISSNQPSSAKEEQVSSDSVLHTPEAESSENDNKWKRIREKQSQTLNKVDSSKEEIENVQIENNEDTQSVNLKLEEENKSLKQQLQYLEAELQNVARRNREGLEKARRYAGVSTVEAFFPLLDSLEVAHDSSTEENKDKADKGKEHILDLMYSIFKKLGVITINPAITESFNPNLHSAVAVETISNAVPNANTIVKVVRKGYSLHERVIRPAMVIISAAEES